MNKDRKFIKITQIILYLLISIVILLRIFVVTNLTNKSNFGFMQFFPQTIQNFILIFIPMLFGGIYNKTRTYPNEVFHCWIIGTITLIVYYCCFFLCAPAYFKIWKVFNAILPIITSTSVLFSGILFSLLVQPYLYDLQKKLSNKQNIIILCLFTVMGFGLSAGTIEFRYSIFGIYLILFFAWGMFLSNIKINSNFIKLLLLLGFISFFIVLFGVPGFDAVHWAQFLKRHYGNWNSQFLNNPTSPFMFCLASVFFLILKKIISNCTHEIVYYIIPIIVLAAAPISPLLIKVLPLTSSVIINKLIIITILILMSMLLVVLYNHYLFKIRPFSQIESFLCKQNSLIEIVQISEKRLLKWLSLNKINLQTLIWFYFLSFCSFLIESDQFRIQIGTDQNVNAIIYLLSKKIFTIILTVIFLEAFFTIIYFLIRRYWTSITLVSILTIGWAIANKIKLNLRAEPIYPSDFSEINNWKTLISMIEIKKNIILIAIFLLIIIIDIFLEIRYPIFKKKSIKSELLWSLLSLLLLITPLQSNHDNSLSYWLYQSFDNIPTFRNPEIDVQTNGPILNFLNYIDLQIMDKPSNYSWTAVNRLNKKYHYVAKKINQTRKNNFSNQTIIFNLSESFVDPYLIPTIKFDKDTPNPVKFIQSIKKQSTYGTMLSAGYGGGTADMEWETLTGLNLGILKSRLTPYVQIVPNYKFYPTIGMNFSYKSTIHPFVGTYYSRVEDYRRFGFDKFVYTGSKYKIINQKKLDRNVYNSDFTTYDNGLRQVFLQQGGQFINLISIQNHSAYNNWYDNNEYIGKVSGKLINNIDIRLKMETYIKGLQYTDYALKKFIVRINKIKKPITILFYGDHYPGILPQKYIKRYPIQMHSTRYFIFANRYARKHNVKKKLLISRSKFVTPSDFIAMILEQTSSKVTPYQALLTKVYQELPAITINYLGNKGFQLVNQKGKSIKISSLNKKQQSILRDYELIQYDMTAGKAYGLKINGFYR